MSTKKQRTSALKRLTVHLIALIVTAAVCYSQDMQNSGTITNTGGGAIRIKGSLTTTQNSYSGTVEFYGSTQSIPAVTYDTLKSSGTGTKSMSSGKTVITDNIIVAGGAVTTTASASDTLELRKQGSVPINITSGSFSATAGGVVSYTQSNQVIYGTTYARLSASGGGTKTTTTAVTVTGTVATGSTSDIIDFGSNTFTGTNATFANTGTLRSQGTVNLGSSTTVNGTFEYYSGSAQTIADATYSGTLNLTGSGAKTINNITIGDVYTVSGGSRNYGTGKVTYGKIGDQTIAAESNYYNLTLGGSGTKTFNGATGIQSSLVDSVNTIISSGTTSLGSAATASFYNNLTVNGTFDASASSTTVTFGGGVQSISGSTANINFWNLTLAGTAAKTSSVNLTIASALTPTRGINMGSTATLAVTNSNAAAIGAFGSNEEVIGNLQRAVSTTGTYKLNNDSTTVSFTGGAPTTFTLRVDSTTNPSPYDASKNVNRKVTVNYASGWSAGYATLKLAYRYTERTYLTSTVENSLRMFKSDGSTSSRITNSYSTSRTASTPTGFGSMTLAGIYPTSSSDFTGDSLLTSGSQIIMSSLTTYFIAINSGAWNSGTTWQGGTAPGPNDDVEISASPVTTTTSTTASSVVVDASGGLALSSGLTVQYGVTNSGSITVPSGQTLQVASTGTGLLKNNSGAVISNSGLIQIGN